MSEWYLNCASSKADLPVFWDLLRYIAVNSLILTTHGNKESFSLTFGGRFTSHIEMWFPLLKNTRALWGKKT